MKKTVLSIIACLAITSSSFAAQNNKIYATVNGDTITSSDIAVAIRDPRVDFESMPKTQKDKILESLIEQKLLSQEAMKSDIPKSKEYKEELVKLKQTLAFQLWMRDLSKTINPTEKQVKKFYDDNKEKFIAPLQLKASHILVKTESEAQDIIKKLSNTKDKKTKFTQLAKELSIGPSGKNGGDLGWFTKEKMVPEFSDAASKLSKDGFTKKPVKTQFGYHIIYLDDKKETSTFSYDQIKTQLKQEVSQKVFVEQLRDKAKQLRKNAKIIYK